MTLENKAAIENIRTALDQLMVLLEKGQSDRSTLIPTTTIPLQNLMLQFLEGVTAKVNGDSNPKAIMSVIIPEETPQRRLTKLGHISKNTNGLHGRLQITFENNANYEPTEEDQALPDDIWSSDLFTISDLLPILKELRSDDASLSKIVTDTELSTEQCSQLTDAIYHPTFSSKIEGAKLTPSAHR